jgi:hypothetical protein
VFLLALGPWPVDTLQENFGGGSSHFAERLADRGQAWILVGSALNVVESDDRNIFRHMSS